MPVATAWHCPTKIMSDKNIVFTQQFQELFSKVRGQAGTVAMILRTVNGSTVYQELSSKALPIELEVLKEKALKVCPKGCTEIKFVNIYANAN